MSWELSEGILAAVNGVRTRNNGQTETREVQTGYKKNTFSPQEQSSSAQRGSAILIFDGFFHLVFKTRAKLNKALSNLVRPQADPAMTTTLDYKPYKIPSNFL